MKGAPRPGPKAEDGRAAPALGPWDLRCGSISELDAFETGRHPDCLACRPRALGGLGLRFEHESDGTVVARFGGDPWFRGYSDRLHGGIIATLLDAAMAHCLLASRIRAYTARMELRYHHAVAVRVESAISVRMIRARTSWYVLEAKLVQLGEVRVSATGMYRSEAAKRSDSPGPARETG